MLDLYNRIVRLCKEEGVNVTVMCRDAGANRASLSDLKMGRQVTLSPETLAKIAAYFGKTVDYVFGIDPQAELDDIDYEVRRLKKEIIDATNEASIADLNKQILALEDRREEVALEFALYENGKKNKPTAEGDDKLQDLLDDERTLLDGYRTMTDKDKEAMQYFMRRLRENAD